MGALATLGVILGNRDFFPDILIGEARRDLVKLFSEMSIEPVWLTLEETKLVRSKPGPMLKNAESYCGGIANAWTASLCVFRTLGTRKA